MSDETERQEPDPDELPSETPNWSVLVQNLVNELRDKGADCVAVAVLTGNGAAACTGGDEFKVMGVLAWMNHFLANKVT